MSTIGAEHPLCGPSLPCMVFSENFRSSPSVVSSSLPSIISYLPVVDSSTWHFHVMIFVALNSGKQKSMFNLFEVVNFPAWFSHIVSTVSSDLSFDVSLSITIVELPPLSNRIQKFLNFAFTLRVFIQPCRIDE